MSRNVLVADNDRLLVTLMQEALEAKGYQVLCAFDGIEVLDQVRRKRPDYIILDLVMPKVDGVQICRHLKEDSGLRSIPIIVLTGAAPEAAHWLKDVRADAFIAKRSGEAILQDLFVILKGFEEGTAPPTWAQEIRGVDEVRPRTIVTELLTHTTHLNAILKNLGEGIFLLDSSHRILYVNPAGAALLLRPERELIGTALATILGVGEDDPLLQALRTLTSREGLATERLVYSYRASTFQVTITNLHGDGWVTGQLLLIRDVSPLFRRIRELAALNDLASLLTSTLDLEELLPLIMERIHALMIVEASSLLLKDDREDTLVFRIGLGKSGELIQGRRLKVGQGIAGWVCQHGAPLIVPDVREDPRFYEGMDRDTGFRTRSALCVPLKTRDKVIGVIQVLNSLTGPTFTEDDQNLLSAIAAHAATAIENARLYVEAKAHAEDLERKVEARTREIEAASAQLAEALRQANEASRHKSDFLANISHELRTPLNSILGFSELLEDQTCGPLTEKQQRYVRNVLSSGRHLLALIDDLLDLSKVEAGKLEMHLEHLPIREALQETLNLVRAQAEQKHQSLELTVAHDLLTFSVDPIRFNQILYNLLSNAVKFTSEGGQVRVDAHRAGEFLEIAVQDTGIGIKAQDMPKLFQEFTQLDASLAKRYQGTGLGLALTKKLVELHGGSIEAASGGPDQGSTFTVRFPLRA